MAKMKKYEEGGLSPAAIAGIAGGVLGLAGGVADFFTAKKRLKEQQPLLDQAKLDVEGAFGNLAANKYQVSESQRQLAKSAGRPLTDPAQNLAAQATALDALTGMDPTRAGAFAPAMASQTARDIQASQQRDFEREMAAETQLANLEQQVLGQNIGAAREMDLLKLQRAMGSEATAAQNIEQLKAQRASAIPGALQNILGFGTALAGSGAFGEFENGGIPVVQKLGGEFNHDTNKKAIVDEETGVKEAEATGGEYILNPEQAQGIHSNYKAVKAKMMDGAELTQEDLMALFEAVDEVFSQPQFNEEAA